MAQQHPSLEDLSSYLDGQVVGAPRLSLEHHLERCPACRRELEGLGATVALLRRVPSAEPRRSFTLEPVAARQPRLWLRWATAVATLLLVAVVSLDVLTSLGAVSLAPSPSPTTVARMAEVATPTLAAPAAKERPEADIARAPDEVAKAAPTPAPSLPAAAPESPLRPLEVALLALVIIFGGLVLAQKRRRPRA